MKMSTQTGHLKTLIRKTTTGRDGMEKCEQTSRMGEATTKLITRKEAACVKEKKGQVMSDDGAREEQHTLKN